jgi:hypothetical protein
MLIRCKIEREGGSHIDLPPAVYHFAPNKKGDHVADIADPDHLALLLSIPAGYEIYEPDGRKKKAAPVLAPEPEPAPVEDPLQPLTPEKGEG